MPDPGLDDILMRLEAPRVCVLGEPRLVSTVDDVHITGQPGRVLVALVATETALSLGQLADMVWSGEPPKSARAALHVHLGSLRKSLDAVTPGLSVDRHGERYSLGRTGWELDVELVHGLVGAARARLDDDDARAAAELLEQAHQLWRGEAFVVAGEEVSAAAAYRLQLLRLDIEEQLVEALLIADEPSRAEALSVHFVEAEPYRELRWAQLMRALAAQGRAADALETYQRVRRILDEALGVAPGDELVRLERSVLTRDPAVLTQRAEPAENFGEIPDALGAIVGRTAVIDQVETLLAHDVPVLLSGAPGAGKTRVAIELVRRASAQGRPVGWVDLRNAAFVDAALADEVTRWARRHAGGLVVLDNAEQAVQPVADEVRELARSAAAAQVVITSRVPIPGVSVVVSIDPLPVSTSTEGEDPEGSDAVRLLRSFMDLLAPGVTLDTKTAVSVCDRLGGLPLGIRLAAELARSVPVSEIAPVSRDRLDSDLAAAVHRSLEVAGEGAEFAFAAVSTVAGQLDSSLMAALIGVDDAHDQISRLVDFGLVQFAPELDAPYSVPEPLRDVGLAMLDAVGRQQVLDRLADECLKRAKKLSLPVPTTEKGLPLNEVLQRQLPWYRQTLSYLASVGDAERALVLAEALELQLYSLGWWQENVDFMDRALAIPGPSSATRAMVHVLRGRPGPFHQYDKEHNRIAMQMALEVGDPVAQTNAEFYRGVRLWWEGRHEEALACMARARTSAESIGDLLLLGHIVRMTGLALVTSGEHDRGVATQLELIQMIEPMPEMSILMPHLYMHLGNCRRHIGDLDAALADLSKARAGFEDLDNRASLIHVCAGLAEIYADLDLPDRALEAAARSLAVSTGGTVTFYEPWALATTARVHADNGDEGLARTAAARAVDALLGTFDGETYRVASQLAFVAHQLGEHAAALRLAGLAEATPDRRELPFRSPGEVARLRMARDAARVALGSTADEIYDLGAASNITEAASGLTVPR